jgi:hypothetical protein
MQERHLISIQHPNMQIKETRYQFSSVAKKAKENTIDCYTALSQINKRNKTKPQGRLSTANSAGA